MFSETLSYHLADSNGHSVSDEAAKFAEAHTLAISHEAIVVGKGLKNRSLSKRDCTILIRMPESAIPETEALCCNGRCGRVPLHSTIYTGIGLS